MSRGDGGEGCDIFPHTHTALALTWACAHHCFDCSETYTKRNLYNKQYNEDLKELIVFDINSLNLHCIAYCTGWVLWRVLQGLENGAPMPQRGGGP